MMFTTVLIVFDIKFLILRVKFITARYVYIYVQLQLNVSLNVREKFDLTRSKAVALEKICKLSHPSQAGILFAGFQYAFRANLMRDQFVKF